MKHRMYEEENFAYRVNYASQCIIKGTRSRAFDTCFEMADGDAVVTALVRRCVKNDTLRNAIIREWGGAFPESWTAKAKDLEHIPTRKLPEEARRERAEFHLASERRWKERQEAQI